MSDDSFTRAAAWAAIAALPLAIGCLVLMLVSVHFNMNAMTNTVVLLRAGTHAGTPWRWSMVLDLLGYYLLLVPLVIYLRGALRTKQSHVVDLSTFCLLAYCLVGAIGAAILATAVPTLMREYAHATSAADLTSLHVTFMSLSDSVYRGLWDLLEVLLGGVGWIGFGVVLRATRGRLGVSAIVLGVACLLVAIGTAVNVDTISQLGLAVYLVLGPVWAAWFGVVLLRERRDAVSRTGPELDVAT